MREAHKDWTASNAYEENSLTYCQNTTIIQDGMIYICVAAHMLLLGNRREAIPQFFESRYYEPPDPRLSILKDAYFAGTWAQQPVSKQAIAGPTYRLLQ
jgi:hypothetical protein